MATPYSCDHLCPCQKINHDTELIVITGGPGAGKTAVLEFVRKALCEHIAILPEVATMLFSGGFWRLDSTSAKQAAQRAIYHVQNEMQTLILGERKWAIGLCDRGTLDSLAYWPGAEKSFYDSLHTSVENEFIKYKAVIHLQSPSLEMGYNHQNPIRTETAELAARIDHRIHEIWKSHPNYFVIESANNFLNKIEHASKQIQSLVPSCCREHLEGGEN